jgi:hypothetical protein
MKKENLTEKGVLKYGINAFLNNRTPAGRLKLKQRILESTGVHEKTLSEWLNIPAGDKREIPSGQLKIIAEILCVPMEELFNDTKKVA